MCLANRVYSNVQKDKELLERFIAFKEYQKDLKTRFFGYPENLNEDSAFVRFLRKKESELYHINNCGDPEEKGNYLMDSKVFEKEVLKLFYDKFGVDEKEGWGYITTGGTESNNWAIRSGFNKYPNAKLYFCEAAHYSVEKSASNGSEQIFPYKIIEQEGKFSEKIDKQKLLDEIEKDWNDGKGNPAVLVLTWGTTKFGAFDDIKEITAKLKEKEIPYFLHVDAACHGGIPKHHENAPVVPSLDELGADSISVSFHKYFGIPTINSVIISKDKAMGKEISYIGQRDTTIAGSRTFPAMSSLTRIRDMLQRSPQDSYIKNINYLEERLKEKNVDYYRAPQSNMFVFPKPEENICKEFQLATFKSVDGVEMAHAIVFPYHQSQQIDRLVERIVCDQKLNKRSFEARSEHKKTLNNNLDEIEKIDCKKNVSRLVNFFEGLTNQNFKGILTKTGDRTL